MMTPPPDLDADAFCLWIKEQIALEGANRLFELNGSLVLYSGPLKEFKEAIEKVLGRPVRRNGERGKEQAAQLSTNILDDTPIGKWLSTFNFVAQFDKAYNGDPDLIRAAIFQVWATVSEELVKAAFGKAVTAVCGADPDRVFYKHELPQIVKETNLDTVNSLPVKLVQEFGSLGIEEAFNLVAKFELLAWHTKAQQATDPTAKGCMRDEWRERWSLYKQNLARARKGRSPPTRAEKTELRQRRRAIRARYDFGAIKAAVIEDTKPTAPAVSAQPFLAARTHP